jgi:hypothetical protein
MSEYHVVYPLGFLYPRESYDSLADPEGSVRTDCQSTKKFCSYTCLIPLPYDDVVILASC